MSSSLSRLFERRLRLRWLLGGAGLVLLLLLLLMFVRFDGEALKASLIERVRAEKQRELRMEGALRLKLLPRLSVEMRDVRLLDSAGKTDFMTLGRLDGALELLPLLMGKILISRIEIRDWTLHLARDAEGRYNFDDLLSETTTDDAPLNVEVKKLILLNGRVTWQDALNARHLALEKVFLRSGRLGLHAQGKLEMGATLRMDATTQAAQLAMTLDTLYRIDGEALRLQLDNLRVNLKGHGQALEQARLALTARQMKADLSARSLELLQLRAQGERAKSETAGEAWAGEIELETLRWQYAAPLLRQLQARLRLADEKLDARLSLEELQGENGRMESPRLYLDWAGNWRKHRYQGELAAPLRIWDDAQGLRMQVEALEGKMRVEPGPSFAEALNLRLAGQFSLEAGGEGAADASAAERPGQGIGALQLMLDESLLALHWQWTHGLPGRSPRLEFQAHLNQLNLDRYLRAEAENEAEAEAGIRIEAEIEAATASSPPPPDDEGKAEQDERLEISGQARIDELHYKGARMQRLESQVCFRQGALSIRQADADDDARARPKKRAARTKAPRANPC
jgi:hypothetical protein